MDTLTSDDSTSIDEWLNVAQYAWAVAVNNTISQVKFRKFNVFLWRNDKLTLSGTIYIQSVEDISDGVQYQIRGIYIFQNSFYMVGITKDYLPSQ